MATENTSQAADANVKVENTESGVTSADKSVDKSTSIFGDSTVASTVSDTASKAATTVSDTGKQVLDSAKLLFGGSSTTPKAETKQGGDDDQEEGQEEEETHDPYYEPIVKLEEVQVKTNEEDEEVLFKM
jgi:hypothetical protein